LGHGLAQLAHAHPHRSVDPLVLAAHLHDGKQGQHLRPAQPASKERVVDQWQLQQLPTHLQVLIASAPLHAELFVGEVRDVGAAGQAELSSIAQVGEIEREDPMLPSRLQGHRVVRGAQPAEEFGTFEAGDEFDRCGRFCEDHGMTVLVGCERGRFEYVHDDGDGFDVSSNL